MNNYELHYYRQQLHTPHPKLSPMDIFPVATKILAIGLAIALIALFIINTLWETYITAPF